MQVKTYHMVDSNDPVLESATGTKIDWKSGKNVTVKVHPHSSQYADSTCQSVLVAEGIAATCLSFADA